VLRINEDLTEAVALGHDLGHAPFGHLGQDILHDLMKDYGGFEHNTQTLRIVSLIEHRYPEFQGLNLTFEVREGFVKPRHRQVEPMTEEFNGTANPTLEAQVVDLSDPITYTAHDLDDGITAGTVTNEMLKDCGLWQEGRHVVMKKYRELPEKIAKYQIILNSL